MSFWENSWDIFWWFFTASVFFAYLFGVFAIIGDLFRDQGLNGWWKSVWIFFPGFLPVSQAKVLLEAGTVRAEEFEIVKSRVLV
jgi:hypothetical protein